MQRHQDVDQYCPLEAVVLLKGIVQQLMNGSSFTSPINHCAGLPNVSTLLKQAAFPLQLASGCVKVFF